MPWPWDDDIDFEVLADEDTLYDPTWDEDSETWWGTPFARWATWSIDDRAAWERELLRTCRRCGRPDALDPLRHCEPCRRSMGRCSWCGLDPVAYGRLRACRTYYRWLDRNLADPRGVGRVSRQLMANAIIRHRRRVRRRN